MGTLLLIAIGAIVIGSIFWDDLVKWMRRAIAKVREIVEGIIYGYTVFIRKLKEGFKEISRHYSKTYDGKWEETVVTRSISENEVPEKFRKMALNNEMDITEELELKLA